MSNSPNEMTSSSSRMLRAWYARCSPGGLPSPGSQARRNCSHAPGFRRRAVNMTIIAQPPLWSSMARPREDPPRRAPSRPAVAAAGAPRRYADGCQDRARCRRPTDRQEGPLSAAAPQGSEEVRVLVVDDQEVFRATLRALIDATEGFLLVGEASTGE